MGRGQGMGQGMGQPQPQGIDQIPVPDQMFEPQGMAGGGIVAFSDGKTVYGQSNKTLEDPDNISTGYFRRFIFFVVVGVGFIYAWKIGALEWD